MKNAAITLALLAVMASTALAQSGDVPVPVEPLLPGNSGPSVFLSARALDIGWDVDGSGSSINPTDLRPGNYAFMGERIIYVVVVRDNNGAQDIQLVKWVKDGDDEMGPCTDVTEFVEAETEENGVKDGEYCFDQDRGDLLVNGVTHPSCDGGNKVEIEISTSTNLQWDPQTDKLYKCVLTVESIDAGWDGSEIAVVASDTSGDEGQSLTENWNFNPPLEVDIDTSDGEPLAFGNPILDQNAVYATEPNCVNEPNDGLEDLTYRDCTDYVACENNEVVDCQDRDAEKLCDVSFSTNKLIVRNVGEVNLWAFIASENFYASSGLAKCPFTNELHANQFEYRATSGSYDSGWRLMPQYSSNLQCAGIGLGDSVDFDVLGQCRGGCRIPAGGPGDPDGGAQTNPPLPGLDILSPTHTIELALKIVWPTPCIGEFDTGNFHVLVRAV